MKQKIFVSDKDWSRLDQEFQNNFLSFYEKITDSNVGSVEYALEYVDDAWQLRTLLPEEKWKPLKVDFWDSSWLLRIKRTWQSKEILRDALKFRKGETLSIVDATAGLCSDSFMMAIWGHRVLAYEQNPITYLLAKDALSRFKQTMKLHNVEIDLRLQSFLSAQTEQVDRVYVDPLYPARAKEALNKKELRILHAISSTQEQKSVDELLNHALKWNPRAIVLKRPQWAVTHSWGKKEAVLFKGQSTRFEVYWVR